MDSLDRKVFDLFSGRVVPKGATKKIKDSANVPTYVLEYLLGTYCTSDDPQEIEAGIEQVKRILADNYVRPDEAEKIKARIKEQGNYTVIDKLTVKLNEKIDQYEADFLFLGIKGIYVHPKYVREYDKLLPLIPDDNYGRAVRWLTSGGSDAELQELVLAAAAVKAGVVSRDPFEAGERRKLNFGHTFAHAIEHEARLRGDDITHGEAVSMGMVLAARLSDALGVSTCLERLLTEDFTAAGLPVQCPYPVESLAEAMDKDKKAEGTLVHFVLAERIGSVIIRDLPVALALNALTAS